LTRSTKATAPRFKRPKTPRSDDNPAHDHNDKLYQDQHFLPIGQSIERMIVMADEALEQFPRLHKPILGKQIEGSIWRLLELVTRAGRRYHKKTTLEDAVIELDMLRSKLRTAFNRKIITPGRYQAWARLNNEIGIELGGWYRSEKGTGKYNNLDNKSNVD
jgi:hypothetical protein